MTFEEFFNKKRINVELMKNADPALYSEFKSHFELMGEKSFDHTKKFWFNKLRHLYHLAEPVKKAVTQVETQIASQAEQLSSPTIEQHAAVAQPGIEQAAKTPAAPKPAFRPRNIPAAAKPANEEQPEADVPAEKPAVSKPAFRPRNIPAAAKPANEEQSEADVPSEKPAVSKPAFKPRNIKPVSSEPSDDAKTTASLSGQDLPSGASQGNAANTPRPAYKPRFNAAKVTAKPEDTVNVEVAAESKEPKVESPSPVSGAKENSDETLPAEQAKPAYKPRFNSKNIIAKERTSSDQQENTGGSTVENESQDNTPDTIPPSMSAEQKKETDSVEIKPEAPKPAYKPRFNAKNLIPKAPEESPAIPAQESATTAEPHTDLSAHTEPGSSLNPAAPAAENPTDPANSSQASALPDNTSEEESPKPAYKPRFNMRNIKPKE